MNAPGKASDGWRAPTLLLWIFFFLVGLFPDPGYQMLRAAADVMPQRALVNSCYAVTIILAVYVGVFCFHRCLDAGLAPHQAQDRALQVAVIGLVAFLPVDVLGLLLAHEHVIMQDQLRVYISGAGKLLAWLFLLSLFIRYYLFNDSRAFANIPSCFPSAHWVGHTSPEAPSKGSSEPKEVSPPLEGETVGDSDRISASSQPAEDCTRRSRLP